MSSGNPSFRPGCGHTRNAEGVHANDVVQRALEGYLRRARRTKRIVRKAVEPKGRP